MWIIVVGSAIWVLIDAKNIGVKKGLVPGLGNIGPWGWFFVTLLLWIIGFPMYLYYRNDFKRAVAAEANADGPKVDVDPKPNTSDSNAIENIEKLASLRDKGVITEQEFEAKKKQLLGI
jgi:hypothetical protein